MRVFVIGTGRTGSTTFAAACRHLTTHTAAHESLVGSLGDDRFAYPDQHIEVDNRLSWFLGDLASRFGDEAQYVHLRRDPEDVARSYERRWVPRRLGVSDGVARTARIRAGRWLDGHRRPDSIGEAFGHSIVLRTSEYASQDERLDACRDLVRTVTRNVELFLSTRSSWREVWIEEAPDVFPELAEWMGADGDVDRAVATFSQRLNAGPS